MRSAAISLLFILFALAISLAASDEIDGGDLLDPANATAVPVNGSAKDSFADMFDRALQKEFPESEQNAGG